MITKKRLTRGTAALIMIAIPGLSSSAETIDLSIGSPLGKTGSATATYAHGLEAHGQYLSDTGWADADLYRRIEVGDRGLGICNPDELVAFPDPTPPGTCGGGDVNELDDMDRAEIITLKLPTGYKWVSVWVSSMDNDTAPIHDESARLYADADGVPNGTTPGSLGDTMITNIQGAAIVEQEITIPPANAAAPYLMFEPYDYVDQLHFDNDFLVWKAIIEEIPVEEVDGRMTGGGSVFTGDPEFRVTHGFEIHCNLAEPNRIQVNWPDHRFHLLSLDEAVCTENAEIHQRPRSAPFDTFEGTGTGRLNGVRGATIVFTFVDGGEPGKRHDTADIAIWDDGGTMVLNVSGSPLLKKGNHQAHPNNKPAP